MVHYNVQDLRIKSNSAGFFEVYFLLTNESDTLQIVQLQFCFDSNWFSVYNEKHGRKEAKIFSGMERVNQNLTLTVF